MSTPPHPYKQQPRPGHQHHHSILQRGKQRPREAKTEQGLYQRRVGFEHIVAEQWTPHFPCGTHRTGALPQKSPLPPRHCPSRGWTLRQWAHSVRRHTVLWRPPLASTLPLRSLNQRTVITPFGCTEAQQLQPCCFPAVGEGCFCPGYPGRARGDKRPGQAWAQQRLQERRGRREGVGFLPLRSAIPTPRAPGPPVCSCSLSLEGPSAG